MGKTKKKGLSEQVRSKKKVVEKKINPFEVKVNRPKHDVLNRKVEKHEKGLPGVSRSKALKKRKETLLVEYKKRDKVNKLIDRRLGENDPEMTLEDKMLQRFALERKRTHEKSSAFNLNEDEELTHYGQSLSEIEKFDNVDISDDDDDDDEGRIGAKIVSEEHFGGFLTKKEGEEGSDGKEKTWKERMEEIITKSKKAKYERQTEKVKAREITDKLDSDWKDLMGLVTAPAAHKGKEAEKEKADSSSSGKKSVDDYDMMVQELKFEIKGTPTDRMKTEEELAAEEKERLDKLEEDRLLRMKGLTGQDGKEVVAKTQHRSADDLDDGFALDKPSCKVQFAVSYDEEGKLRTAGSDSDDEDQEEEEEGDQEGGSGEDEESGEEEDDDNDDDAMEHLSDLESEGSSDDDGEKTDAAKTTDGKAKVPKEKPAEAAVSVDAIKSILKVKKKIMEAARKELPYTFKAPVKYEDLLELFEEHSEDDQLTIIERLRKCHHPSLAEGNKTKLETLFTLLLEYYGDLALQQPPCLALMDRISVDLYELCQMSPVPAAEACLAVIKKKHEQLVEYAENHSGRGLFPNLDTLLHLKLVSLLFPTSDFHHHVITPAVLYMSELLTVCVINTRRDIASGLFVSTLFLQYVSFSKRFVPEVINFLCGVMFLAIKKSPNKVEPVIPPFKPFAKNASFLELQTGKEARDIDVKPVKLTDVFCRKRALYLNTDEFRVGCMFQCLQLLHRFSKLYVDLAAFAEIFEPVKYFSSQLPLKNYPDKIKCLHKELQDHIESTSNKCRSCLTHQKQAQPVMKMFEPKFEDSFDGSKHRGGSREFNEKQRLVHKYKREKKATIRDIRQDFRFLADQKLKEKLEKDAERKRKVKELYHDLATQEGEVRALKRKKDSAS